MAYQHKISKAAGLMIVIALLSACGGGSSGSSSGVGTGGTGGTGNVPPPAVEGVATPSSVAVVTEKGAA